MPLFFIYLSMHYCLGSSSWTFHLDLFTEKVLQHLIYFYIGWAICFLTRTPIRIHLFLPAIIDQISVITLNYLKCGFHKKYFRKNEPLTSWTPFFPRFFYEIHILISKLERLFFFKKNFGQFQLALSFDSAV